MENNKNPYNYKVEPTLGLYGLEGIDLEKIKEERHNCEIDRKQPWFYYLLRFINIMLMFGGMLILNIPFFLIYVVYSLFQEGNSFLSSEDFVLGLIMCFVGIVSVWLGMSLDNYLKKMKEKVPYEKEALYQQILLYEKHVKEYNEHQFRKKVDFWDKLSGRGFEIEVANLFGKQGYKSTICKQGGDGGVDIELKKGDSLIAVQCKAHHNKISPGVARDLLGTVVAGGYSAGYLVTLNGGTEGTIKFCKDTGITLLDKYDLIDMHNSLDNN